jgi:tRNA-splicing ligase RtcB (3'-phosphate/5'-hydroxy nucleic acid ligase)
MNKEEALSIVKGHKRAPSQKASYGVYEGPTGGIIKAWVQGVPLEDSALEQLLNASTMPFIHKHIAVMPDVHKGIGATVGSVIATKGAIIPAAVGVDIGCGMVAVKTSLKASQLPDNLSKLRSEIEAHVPHGRTNNGKENDKGRWGDLPTCVSTEWGRLQPGYDAIIERHPKALSRNTPWHLGTLGTGNHFIEVCLDEDQYVWVMLHSGSRGPGNAIGQYFITRAKQEMDRYFITENLRDKDLAYLVEHTELFDDYVGAVAWAQDYAMTNRRVMLKIVLKVLKKELGDFKLEAEAVNCHHNYISLENHFNANVFVTRKGAVRARSGDLGIIPGSMGTGSYIVEGKGNLDSFTSCSHGAGRRMSRTVANRTITLEDHALAMKGIECRLDKDVLDESPAAYKNLESVMNAQKDLVTIKHHLKQVVNVKG